MNERITPFLTFQENNAEEAMHYYIELFDNSEILSITHYGKDGPASEGSVMMAMFILDGKKFICSDSYVKHEWTFSPAISLFTECQNENHFQQLFEKLSENGQVLMEPENYGFSRKFSWVQDKFGISWQLNLQ